MGAAVAAVVSPVWAATATMAWQNGRFVVGTCVSSRPTLRGWTPLVVALSLIISSLFVLVGPPNTWAASTTTAWQNGKFSLDPAGAGRSST
jgi:hypothetical protein